MRSAIITFLCACGIIFLLLLAAYAWRVVSFFWTPPWTNSRLARYPGYNRNVQKDGKLTSLLECAASIAERK